MGGKVFSILSLIASILSVVLCCIPGVGLALGLAAVVLGIVGLVRHESLKAMSIIGIIIGAIGLILGVIMLLSSVMGSAIKPSALSSSLSSDTSDNSVSETYDNETKEENSVEYVEEEKEEEIQNKSEIYVGDSIMDGDMKIVYVKSGKYVEDNQFMQPKDGYEYVYIEIYCENTGSYDRSISAFDFDCYADGYAVEQNYYTDGLFSATLSAGRTTTGQIVFEVPKDASDVEFEYNLNVWTSQHVKFIYEGEKDSGFVPETNTSVSEDVYRPGDIVETSQLKITYISCGEFKSDNMFIQPKEGYKYLYMELEVENISSSDQYISSLSFDGFADGASCNQSYYTGDDNLDATISAGRKTKGKIVFEVPKEATTVEFEYLDNYWTSNRIIFLYE